MMGQPMLDFETSAKVRTDDPDTSYEAWERLVGKLGSTRRIVYEDLRRHGGSTYREVSERTGLAGVTVSGRFTELRRRGLIRRGVKRDGAYVHRT